MNEKRKYIILVFILMLFTLGVGTFAWLSYRTNDTAMVLTIGEINNVRVTLSPYQVNAKIIPVLTYTGENYTSVNAVNNSSISKEINLYYVINTIDNELATNKFKYTITRSTDGGRNYTEYASGNFLNVTNNSTVDILSETIPSGTTYDYRVYLWLDGNGSNQNNIVGKKFNGDLNASIVSLEYNYEYTGSYQVLTIPKSGYYFVQLWASQGSGGTGGKGGYTSGNIYMNAGEALYVYVGGYSSYTTGSCYSTNPNANFNASTTGSCSGGGGATDIRYFGNDTLSTSDLNWNSAKGLNSRIMVAGGGGGQLANYSGYGGVGGTLFGGDSSGKGGNASYFAGVGGKQNTGLGGFGNPTKSTTIGGGGYYGGQGGTGGNAGGGSSFMSGYAGANAISGVSNRTHKNDPLHYSNKYFLAGTMTAGINAEYGKAKITYIGSALTKTNITLNNVRYIKDCINGNNVDSTNRWMQIQAIKDGKNVAKGKNVTAPGTANTNSGTGNKDDIVNGIISTSFVEFGTGNQCVIVDLGSVYDLDEIAIWHYFADGRTYSNNVTSVSSNNSSWTTVINNNEAETSNGKRVNAWN